MKVSIVITNYEAEGILRRCLPEVVRYAEASEVVDEVIVVDDGSRDGSCEFVRSSCPAVKLVSLPENRGFSRTANAGFRAARNPYVLLLSNDMVPGDGCVEALLPHLEDEAVFAATVRQINDDGETLHAANTISVQWGEPKWRPASGCVCRDFARPIIHFGGATSLYNRQHVLDMGGFDEELFLPFYVEDTDLFYRAWKRGLNVIYEPRACVYHYQENPATIVNRFAARLRRRMVRRNRFFYVWKNVHDRRMLAAHAVLTILRVMFSWLIADFGYYGALSEALKRRRTVVRKRHEERLASRRTDEEAIKAIGGEPVRHPSILIIRRRYLGDLILMGAALKNVRRHVPQAWITVVVDENYRDVLSKNRDVTEILALPQQHGGSAWVYAKRWVAFIKQLRTRRYDVAYDLTQGERSALVVRLCKARQRVSYLIRNQRNWRHRLYDVLAPWTDSEVRPRHLVDFFLAPFEAVGVPIATRSIAMDVYPDDAAIARRLLAELFPGREGPLVMVHPGSRVAHKCWPPENFAAVCDAVTQHLKARVLVLGGRKDDPAVGALVAAAQTKPPVLNRQLPVPQLAALLKEADVYLGNDSGPMHVAAAVGTRVVALFGRQPTSWCGPVGDSHIILQPPDCAPCPYPDVCQPPNGERMLCVRRITVDEVIEAVERQLTRARHVTQGNREAACSE